MLQGTLVAPAVARALAEPEVLAWLQPPADTPPLELAIRRLVPTRSNAAIHELFLGRITTAGIRSWRIGRRSTPQWARDILKEKLRAQSAELLRLAERL